MKKSKRIISLVLSILMIVTSLPLMAVNSFAADVVKSGTTGECTWTLDSDGVLTISGNGKMGKYYMDKYPSWGLSITKVVIENGVTNIGDMAFTDCKSLTSITIPDSVTSIGWSAFYGCTSLISITIPDSVTSIDEEAFANCTSLTSITIPESVTSIGYLAFWDCTSLTSVTIPDSVTSIGGRAFENCTSLTSITIPDGVTSIGDGVFEGCTSLKEINVGSDNANYSSENGILFNKAKTKLIKYPAGKTEPEYIILNSVTRICDGAFSGCTLLTSINIPDGVTSIGDGAFEGCTNLKRIDVAENNKNYCSIDGVLFNKAKTKLIKYPAGKTEPEYIIPNSVTRICDGAFSGCTSLVSITIPDGVISIGSSAFSGCTSLTSATIGNGVTSIVDSAFGGCTSLTSITIPDSVTSIGYGAFEGCTSLTSITIPDSVTSIDWSAFYGCTSLISITIPNSVTSVGGQTFVNCTSLTNITIPDSVISIGRYAFSGCTSLTSITIPDSVTSIFDRAFEGCTSLSNITIPDSVTYIGGDAFSNTAYYNNKSNWDNGILYIGNHLIRAKEDISGNVSIKQGTKTIAVEAFELCTSLTSITIPDSVTSIGRSAFSGCTSLTSVKIGNGVTSIDWSAFKGCTSLTDITIPDSVTSIGWNAFYGCTSLVEINVGSENEKFSSENGVLFNKDKTKLITYPLGKKDELYVIPDSVTSIVDSAFEGCTSLTSITIPDSVTSIGYSAFYNCTSLTSVTIPGSVTDIGDQAFGYYYSRDYSDYCKIENFVIYGKVDSEAERYANKNGFKFVAIGDAPTMTFPDVRSGDWYSDAVKYNFERGYITGYSNGTFGPANNIQRQDFVLILARIAGADLSAYEGQNGGFSDVQTGSYYASAVAWAKDTGVANGFSADNFGVGTFISREQICIMLCRYLNGSVLGNADTILNAYPDGGNTSPWAKESVAWAVENGIIGNAGYINPIGNAGRAEVAQIIYNMANNEMI